MARTPRGREAAAQLVYQKTDWNLEAFDNLIHDPARIKQASDGTARQPVDAAFVIFIGGNQFFVLPQLISGFEAQHPELRGRIFYETLPPGILRRQMAADDTATPGNLTLQIKPDVYEAGARVLKSMHAAGQVSEFVEYATNTLHGNAGRGAQTYAAQCAGCHGADGAGVPPVLPPIWGLQSYNHGAGMNSLKDLGAFLIHNMPQSHVGSLTPQQAFDVAAYVHSMPRPGFNESYKQFSARIVVLCVHSGENEITAL